MHPWVRTGTGKIRMGVHFLDSYHDWPLFHERVLEVEALGFDSIWVADHPTQIADCWSALAALAVTTTHLRLGSLVSCVFYRNPVLLARLAVDVDRWSGGRLVLGLGIGDMPAEFHQFNLSYGSVSHRQAALEETIQVLKELWLATPVTFQGTYLQVQAQIAVGPIQQPSIPLLLAGGGERVTLRQVAQYADMSNFGAHVFTGGATQLQDVERKCHVLQDYCHFFGRDPQAVLRSYITMPLLLGKTPECLERKRQALPLPVQKMFQSSIVAMKPQEAIAYYRTLRRAGIQYFIVGIGLGDRETLHLLQTEVLPALNE